MRWIVVLLFATSVAAETVSVPVHETTVVKFARATAAYAVDPSVADAVARGGEVSVSGRSAGSTQVVVVSGNGQLTFDVEVTAPLRPVRRAKSGGTNGVAEVRYDTADKQTHGVIDVRRDEGTRRTELHVESVHYAADSRSRAATTLPSVSYSIISPKSEITVLDRVVDQSPLTVSNTSVRGLHFIGERWRMHAGTTAFTSYESFLLPSHNDKVIGAAYAHPLGASSTITPSAFVTSKGSIASLMYDYKREESLFARGELAVSRGLGGAVQLGLDRSNQRLRLDLSYRPQKFATISVGEPRGFFADASYSRTFGRGSMFDTSFTSQKNALASTSNVRLRLNDSLSLISGASYGRFSGVRSFSVPAGVQFDRHRFGASATARWTNGAPGFRVSTRTSLGRIYASAYVDYQRQAPTLAIIYRDIPELAEELEELGITATSPADIARALRENSALIELGYIDGVTVDLSPERTQAGVELSWLGTGPSRMQVRARLLANRYESVARQHQTMIATLSVSRRLTEGTDLFASYTWWESDGIRRPQAELGIRRRFDELPSFTRGSISGRVTSAVPVEVELDGGQRAKIAGDGSFAFRHVAKGAHRVSARIVDASDAYFTGPSRVDAKAGDFVTFDVATSLGHLFGRIVSDSGDGVAGVEIALTRGATRMQAMSSTDGTFTINAAPGEWVLAVDALSLPAGFSMNDDTRSVMLAGAQPSKVAFAVRANRSVSGVAPAGVRRIDVLPLGLQIPVGADGRFTIRSLPAGKITLKAGKKTSVMSLPHEPAMLIATF